MEISKKIRNFLNFYSGYVTYTRNDHNIRIVFLVILLVMASLLAISNAGKIIGPSVCEGEGRGDWSEYDGYFGSCWNISWETCEKIGGFKQTSSLNGIPTCVLDLW